MHALCADLDLQGYGVNAHYCAVQPLVPVLLGAGNKIVEMPRNRVPETMDHSKSAIAVRVGVYEYAEGQQIMYIAELLALRGIFLHLGVYAVDALWSPDDLCFDTCFLKFLLEDSAYTGYVTLPAYSTSSDQLGDLMIGIRLKIAE